MSLRIYGENVTDYLAIAEVGPKITRNIETSALIPDMFMGPRNNGNIFLSPTYREEVTEIIHTMKNKRSYSHDNITSTLLKETKKLLSQQLSTLINKSLSEGI